MNVNLLSYSQPLRNFTAQQPPKYNYDMTEKIKSTISEISKYDDLSADIGTISKMSGYSIQEVYNCLHESNNYELYEFWQESIRANYKKPSPENLHKKSESIEYQHRIPACKKETVIFSTTDTIKHKDAESVSNDIDKIEAAIREILNNNEIEATVDNISRITGIPQRIVYARIYSPNSNICNLWQYVQSVKEDDTIERRRRLAKFYRVQDDSIAKRQNKNLALALKIIKQAVANHSKISYRTIEERSGLNKAEVDELIASYAKTRQEQARLARTNKELQAKWYEQNSVS